MRMKALIRNIAKEKNINSAVVLRNYVLERLLKRISKSKYKDNGRDACSFNRWD